MVFVIHATEPFNPWTSWHVTAPQASRVLGEMALFSAPWVLPLFLFLAGAGTRYSLDRRTPGDYLARRLRRVGIPLLIGVPVLVAPQVWAERRWRGQFDGSLLEFLPRFVDGWYPTGNFALHHLWFLVALLAITVVTMPIVAWVRRPAVDAALDRLARRADGLTLLLATFAAALGFRLAIWWAFPDVPLAAHDWPARSLLLPAYLFGALYAGSPALQRAVAAWRRSAAVIAAACSVVLAVWAWPGDVLARLPTPRTAMGAAFWSVYVVATWSWLVALAGYAVRHLRHGDRSARRLAEAVYPFFLLHQTPIVLLAVVVVRWDAGVAAQWLTVLLGAFVVTAAATAVATAWGPARRLLGMRRVCTGSLREGG